MPTAATLANRALEREDWARERLSGHAGRTLRVVAGPADLTLSVDVDGRFAEAQAAPDLTLTISPLRLPALLARPGRWHELVEADGDAALASTIAELAQTLPWFVERAFSRAFGPIVGVELADAGRRLLALPGYAAERAGASLASYARDEADLAIGSGAVRDFATQVAALAERVATLGERVDRLAGASATPGSQAPAGE
ncbi:MAG: ubiquinone biosynthesis accessory factor UbiJ [Casimicrobiaceae bacterium]